MKEIHLKPYVIANEMLKPDPSLDRAPQSEPLHRETYESILQRAQRIGRVKTIGIDAVDLPVVQYETPGLKLENGRLLSIRCLEFPNHDWRLSSRQRHEAIITIIDPYLGGRHDIFLDQATRTIQDLRYGETPVGGQVPAIEINQAAALTIDKWLATAENELGVPAQT